MPTYSISLDNARQVTHKWVDDYNHKRPHQALNYQTPMAYAA
ncbi:MAG: transposase [Flammeovirgaceae bacterium]|nr:MAG: transposase [Flammeovirgaceae bacterium]